MGILGTITLSHNRFLNKSLFIYPLTAPEDSWSHDDADHKEARPPALGNEVFLAPRVDSAACGLLRRSGVSRSRC